MALDFLQSMFGGSNQTSDTKPVDLTPEQFAGLRTPFANSLTSLLQSNGPQYGGPLTAPLGGNESSLLSGLMTQGGPRNQLMDQTLNGDYLNSNPFLSAAITAAQRPTMQNLTETLGRTLPGRFTQAGQFVQPQGSSAFDRAAAIATRGAASAMGDIATNMSYGNYNDERNRQQQAIPLSQQEVQTTIQNLQAQALPRLIQENGIDRGIDLFKTQMSDLLQVLGILGGVSQPVIASQSHSQGDSTGGIVPGISKLVAPMKLLSGGTA